MLLTHLFESPNAKARAHYWLTLHGFDAEHQDISRDGSPRLALCVSMAQVPAALALLDSIDLADREGHPGLPEALAFLSRARAEAPADSSRLPIHWDPRGEMQVDDPQVAAVRDYMAGYHE